MNTFPIDRTDQVYMYSSEKSGELVTMPLDVLLLSIVPDILS